jgi:hypothetical protein
MTGLFNSRFSRTIPVRTPAFSIGAPCRTLRASRKPLETTAETGLFFNRFSHLTNLPHNVIRACFAIFNPLRQTLVTDWQGILLPNSLSEGMSCFILASRITTFHLINSFINYIQASISIRGILVNSKLYIFLPGRYLRIFVGRG